MKLLDLRFQYQAYRREIDDAIKSVLESTCFIGGEEIASLEKEMEAYCGVPHAIACSSGTDALLLALLSLDVGPGDEIITTPYSFIATAEVVLLLRAKVVFVDVEYDTYNIDPKLIKEKITDQTKAIIPVSLFGQPADMETINMIAQERGVTVIEDAAQSFGGKLGVKKSCNLSKLATTSFFPAKPFGCYGDGGAVFTQDEELAQKIRTLLNHGQTRRYYHEYIGINGRLDALQAAILRVKLKYLDEELASRNRIADFYNQNIDTNNFTYQTIRSDCFSTYAQYCLTVASSSNGVSREEVIDYLQEEGVPTSIYYPVPIHLQKPFRAVGYTEEDFLVSESLSRSMFALPVHPFLTKEEQHQVVEAVNTSIK